MITDEHSIEIARPVEEVFAFVSDVRNNPLWCGAFVESTVTSGDGVGVGSTSRHVVRFLGKRIEADAVITDFVPNRRSCIRTTTGPIPTRGCRTVEPVEGGARVTQTIEASPGRFFGLAERIVVRIGAHQIETDLLALKYILESDAALPSG